MFAGSVDVDGRYRADESLGGGAVTLVFGARHLVLGKAVALKVLKPELAADAERARRFLAEARAASQLAHENIIAISDLGRDASIGAPYLVMERVAGTTLEQALEAPMPLDRALRILVQIARAMTAAHAAGVVHRDLNPRNIFLVTTSGRDDHVKIGDFGMSAASERARDDGAPDPRIDLYGFGLTAHEMLAGRASQRASSNGEHTPAPPPRPELPPELDHLITRCLAFDPADRPANALEVEIVLTSLIERSSRGSSPGPLIGQMIGTHRVLRVVGTGGIGTVYEAEHPLIGTHVAIKVLRPEFAAEATMVERFVLEARASSMIGSPHIPRFLDFGYLPNGQPFAVMEFLSGETLGSRLAREGRIALGEVVAIVTQVASAMSLAHARGIVHRDLKPDNMFLARDEAGGQIVKVLDFGIAKLLTADVATRTQTGLVFGTLVYCSPEQALGASVGPAADVYALGATMYEMLAGQPPFKAAPSCLAEKTTKAAPSIHRHRPDLPAAVARDLDAMLARHPAARPTMAQVFALLEGWTREPAPDSVAVSGEFSASHDTHPGDDHIDELPPMDDTYDEPADEPSPWRWVGIVGGVALLVVMLVWIFASGGDSATDRPTDTKRVRESRPSAPARVEPRPATSAAPTAQTTPSPSAPSATPPSATPPSATPPSAATAPTPTTRTATPPATPSAGADKPAVADTPKAAPPAPAAEPPATEPKRSTTSKRAGKTAGSAARPDDGVIVDPFKD